MASKLIVPIFKIAESEAECEAALRLVAKVFALNVDMPDYGYYKKILWYEDPAFEKGNLVLAVDTDGTVIGVVRIVPRVLYRNKQPILAAGISSVCIDEDYRGQGLSRPMMEFALATSRDRGSELAVLFARRKQDFYYTRFGFWGVASYSKIKISIPVAVRQRARGCFRIKDIDVAEWGIFSELYKTCYCTTFGYVERSLDYWKFIERRIQYLKETSIKQISLHGNIVGYFIVSINEVYELAGLPGEIDLLDMVVCIENATGRSSDELTFSMSPDHLMMSSRYDLDKTVSFRSCSFGGNMVKILDVKKLVALWIERIEHANREISPLPFSGEIGPVRYEWDGKVFNGEADPAIPDLSYDSTCLLLGCQSTHLRAKEIPFRLDSEPFDMPIMDQM